MAIRTEIRRRREMEVRKINFPIKHTSVDRQTISRLSHTSTLQNPQKAQKFSVFHFARVPKADFRVKIEDCLIRTIFGRSCTNHAKICPSSHFSTSCSYGHNSTHYTILKNGVKIPIRTQTFGFKSHTATLRNAVDLA